MATAFPTFIDVPDPNSPPPGAEAADAAFLNSLTAAVNASEASAWGIVNCSQMTTASEINAAALAAYLASGDDKQVQIWLGARLPSDPLLIDTTLIRRPRQAWAGLGGRQMLTCIEAAPAFPAGQPLMAAEGYMTNATSADEPGSVKGIHLNTNGKTGSHGLVVYDFWSEFSDIQVQGCDGTTAHGIHVTDRGIDGVTVSTNSHSENRFEQIRCMSFTNGAHGFWAESTNGLNNSNQDGHLIDCYFAGIGGHGVNITRAAGWTIKNVHEYGIGLDGIRLANCYATKVSDCYVENFGQEDAAGGFYTGINLVSILNADRASIVTGNTVSSQQPSTPTGSRWACYNFRAGTSQLRAAVEVAANTATLAMTAAPTTRRSQAFRFGEGGDTGRLLEVEWGSNLIQHLDGNGWWERLRVVNVCVDFRGVASTGVATLTDAATVAIDAPRAREFRLAATANRTIGVPTDPVDGQEIVIAHTAVGSPWTLSLTTGTANSFAFGSNPAALSATGAGLTDYITARYSATAARWRVVDYRKDY